MIASQFPCLSPKIGWIAALVLATLAAGCANMERGEEERDIRVPELNLTRADTFLRRNRTIVVGNVIDRISGQPIAGASVVVRFPGGQTVTAMTNANGVFTAVLNVAFNQGGRVDAATVVDGSASDSSIMLTRLSS